MLFTVQPLRPPAKSPCPGRVPHTMVRASGSCSATGRAAIAISCPAFSAVFSAAPVAWVTKKLGMTTFWANGSVGPILMRAVSATLLITTTALAPFIWALSTFSAKLQIPRSISAILPVRSLLMLPHPSVLPCPLLARTIAPEIPHENGPKRAICALAVVPPPGAAGFMVRVCVDWAAATRGIVQNRIARIFFMRN